MCVVVPVTVFVTTELREAVDDTVDVLDDVEESERVEVIREEKEGNEVKLKLEVPVEVFVCEDEPLCLEDDVDVFDTRGLKDPVGDIFADIDSLLVYDSVGLNLEVEVRLGLQEFIDPGDLEVEGETVLEFLELCVRVFRFERVAERLRDWIEDLVELEEIV